MNVQLKGGSPYTLLEYKNSLVLHAWQWAGADGTATSLWISIESRYTLVTKPTHRVVTAVLK